MAYTMSKKADLQRQLKVLQNELSDTRQNDHSKRVSLEWRIAEIERKIEKEIMEGR